MSLSRSPLSINARPTSLPGAHVFLVSRFKEAELGQVSRIALAQRMLVERRLVATDVDPKGFENAAVLLAELVITANRGNKVEAEPQDFDVVQLAKNPQQKLRFDEGYI